MPSIIKNKKQYYKKYYNTIKGKLITSKRVERFLYDKEGNIICRYSNSEKDYFKTRKKLPAFRTNLYSLTTYSDNIYTPINKKIFTPDGLLVCMKPSISEDEIEQNIKHINNKIALASSSLSPIPLVLQKYFISHHPIYHSNHYVKMYKSIINFVNFLGFKNTRKIIKIIDNGNFNYNNEYINGILNKIQNSFLNISVHEFILNFTTIKWVNIIKFLLNDKE